MDTLVWVSQILLAITFGYSGIMKSTQSREHLVAIGQTAVENLSYPLIRFIGYSEILGTFGIMIPSALKVMPVLTPMTACCFSLIMILAAPMHYKRKEYKSMLANIFLLVISIFVAWIRFSEINFSTVQVRAHYVPFCNTHIESSETFFSICIP